MSLETLSSSSHIISEDETTLNLVIWTTSNQMRILQDGDSFIEHNLLVYVKTMDGTIKCVWEYFQKDIHHLSLGTWVQARQLDAHQKLLNIH